MPSRGWRRFGSTPGTIAQKLRRPPSPRKNCANPAPSRSARAPLTRSASAVGALVDPGIEDVLFALGVRPQPVDEGLDAIGAKAVQIEIDAELQEVDPDPRVFVQERPRFPGPILGERRDEVSLLRFKMVQQRALELQPL